MTRELWVRPTGQLDQVAGAALEAGASAVVATADERSQVETVGRVPLATLDGEVIELSDRTARIASISTPSDQEQARKLLGEVDVLVVRAEDWTIIPLENLIAWTQGTSTKLFAWIETTEDAELALTTLETGVHGLLLATGDPATVHAVAKRLNEATGASMDLVEAEITAIKDAGMGDRVCVDTTSLLQPDEGLLVGSTSSFLVLVASEASEAGYVASRPFRVNAGAVHAYVLGPEDTTKYLSEVAAGVPLVAVNRDGATRRIITGRAKVERRPMLLVHLRAGEAEGTAVLQNAETIRLITPDGPTSISELAPGDTVLVHLAHGGGRHFGTAIEETVTEV